MPLTGPTLRERLGRIAIGLALVVGPIIGCNNDDDYYPYYGSSGAVSSSGFSGSSGTTGGFGSADAGRELCEIATEGTSCYSARLPGGCERGTSADLYCNEHFTCGDDNVWEKDEPQRPVCADQTVCPTTYTETVADDLCKRPDAISLLCEYDEGTCGCGPVGGIDRSVLGFPKRDAGAKDGGDGGDSGDAPVDAGSKADAGPRTYEWKCVHGDHDAGCPRRRPREGIDCVRPLSCDYGFCVFEDGFRMDCSNGSWVRDIRSDICDQ